MTVPTIAKRLLETTAGEHPVISAVFDLNPSEFATAPARATQATSLIDAGHNLETAYETFNHDARQAVRSDLDRLDGYLGSADFGAGAAHAGALAIYLSSGDDLFETVVLSQPAPSSIVIARQPQLEPLVTEPVSQRWCAVLVSEHDVAITMGTGAAVTGRQTGTDFVRGHSQSDGNNEHGHEQDVQGHLIEVAQALAKDARAGQFDVLVLGGPVQARTGLQGHLANDVRGHLLGTTLDVDPSAATEADVAAAVVALLRTARAQEQEQAQSHFDEQFAAGDRRASGLRAVAGITDVLEALTEQRVETLLLAGDFHAAGTQCPQCGLLYDSEVSTCPVDGTATSPVADLREPLIAAAVRQDASVIVADEPGATLGAPDHRVGAVLRF
jgi:peptide chain release factor subunit 1